MNTQAYELNSDKQVEHSNDTSTAPVKRLKLIFKLLIGIGCALLASGLCLIIPIVGMLSIIFVFLCVLLGLGVYGLCDWQGLGAYLIVMEALAVFIGGPVFACAMLLYLALPLAAMAYLDIKRTPFFKRVYTSFAIELIGCVAALGLIVLIYKQNLGDLLSATLKVGFAEFSDSMKDMLVSYYRQLYSAMGLTVSYTTGDEMLAAVADTCGEYIKQALPSMLIVMAAINVLPGVKLCSWIEAKRNLPDAVSEPISKWRMPMEYIVGLIVLTVTGFVLYLTLGARGEVVLSTVLTLALTAGVVQAFASFADRFGGAPMPKGFKIAMAILSILFFMQIIPYFGVLSMLAGSQGLITQIIKKHNENRQDPDDTF